MVTDYSRRAVDDALARLGERFGDVPVAEERWSVDPAEHARTTERFRAGTVGGAGAWIRRDGAALLVREAGASGWSEPAGKQEPDESLAETAVRETREETGVTCEPTDVVRATWTVLRTPEDPALHRLIVVFGARYVRGEPSPREGEIADVRWFDEHPADLAYPAVAEYPL